MLSQSAKKSQVQKLKQDFSKSKASFVVNCIGLNVEEMTELRKNLKKNKGNIQVIKNTLSLISMEDDKLLKDTYSSFIKGPNAFVLAFEDPVKVAKVIDKLEEDSEIFKIKAGIMEGKALSPQEVKDLAQLPSEEVLKAQFLGLLQAPMQKFLSTIKEVPEGFARVLSAKKDSSQS